MSAFKLQHKKTGKFLSTSASTRYLYLYMCGNYEPQYSLEKAVVENGRVYSTRKGAQNVLDRLEKYPKSRGEFEIKEIN